MNTVTTLITYATVSNSGTFAGRPYDLYKQVRYDARRGTRQVLHRLKNPHGCLSPWIRSGPAAEKQKGLSSDRPYIFVFYRNMKVKKGRRLVRSSVMLKRTAALL